MVQRRRNDEIFLRQIETGHAKEEEFCYVLPGIQESISKDQYSVRQLPASSKILIEYLMGDIAIIYVRYNDGSHDCGYVAQAIHGIEQGHEFFTREFRMETVPLTNKRNSSVNIRNQYNKHPNVGFLVLVDEDHPLKDPDNVEAYLEEFGNFLREYDWISDTKQIISRTRFGSNNYIVPKHHDVTLSDKRCLGDVVSIYKAINIVKRKHKNQKLDYNDREGKDTLDLYFAKPYNKTLSYRFGMN